MVVEQCSQKKKTEATHHSLSLTCLLSQKSYVASPIRQFHVVFTHALPYITATMPLSSTHKPFLLCPDFRCRKKFASDTWRLRHIREKHPDLELAPLRTVPPAAKILRRANQSTPTQGSINTARTREFNANKDPVEDSGAYPYIEHLENVEESMTDEEPPPEPRTETYPNAGAPLEDYVPQTGEGDENGCLEDNLRDNPYYPFATREEFNYVQCGIKKKGMKTYYDEVLKERNTALHFPSFKNGDGVKRLVAAMPDDKALGGWERHTLLDMRWNSDHPQPIKYWARDIIKAVRWLLRQPAYAEHLVYAPQRVFSSEGKRIYGEMNTGEWWWNEQVSVAARIDYPPNEHC